MVSREEIARVARLARLEIDEDRLEVFAGQIDRILNHVGQLEELDVSEVKPMMHAPGSETVFRDDEVGDCLETGEALQNAPDQDPPHFRVPRTI